MTDILQRLKNLAEVQTFFENTIYRDAAEEIERLRKALAGAEEAIRFFAKPDEPRAPLWLPIATAPKQGYLIGAWKEGKWHAREMWWDDTVEEWTDTMSDRYLKPTHWTPTPENRRGEPT